MTEENPIKVLIVDDSAVMRSVISRIISAETDMKVVGTAENGELGVKSISSLKPDVVILDLEMPVMDGITALPLMLKEKADLPVLICSTLSSHGADISIRALALGAAECILKPGGDAILSAHDFQKELVKVVRTLAARSAVKAQPQVQVKAPVSIRQDKLVFTPKVLALGSSTGGPKALMEGLKDLKGLSVPIVITQHMPKIFTAMLAQHITQNCGIPCSEGKEGEILKPGQAYVAPGDYHMGFKKLGNDTVIHLNQEPPENFCRPSVNPMIRGLMDIHGGKILTVILTGMGQDGSQACATLAEKGGRIIAQDEATSVVWGMPGAVAKMGVCNAVLPLEKIAEAIRQSLQGKVLS